MNANEIDGWMSERELKWLAEVASRFHVVLEFGSWKGRSTKALASAMHPLGKVYAVDHFEGTIDGVLKCGDVYQQFCANLADEIKTRKVVPVACKTADFRVCCPSQFLKAEMVFIDADHSYEAVKADIRMALSVLADPGVICGHDYTDDYPGVKQAVHELVPTAQKIDGGDIWWATV